MGLLNWYRKHKSKIPRESRKKESPMLKSTLTKAKKYGGDPFYESRIKGQLPEII